MNSERTDGTFSRSDFEWKQETTHTHALSARHSARTGVIVHSFGSGVAKADSILYRSSARDCGLKMQCYPNTPIRKIARRIPEQARDVVRRLSTTTGYLQSRCERKKVEMLFVHLKRILRLDRLRLRSMNGARDAILMAARVQNLRKMAK